MHKRFDPFKLEMTEKQARRVKAAHVGACAGIVAIVAVKVGLTAIIAYKQGVKVGERRAAKALAAESASSGAHRFHHPHMYGHHHGHKMMHHHGAHECCTGDEAAEMAPEKA